MIIQIKNPLLEASGSNVF